MTPTETFALLELLCEAFPQRKPDNPARMASVYHLALDDVPYDLGMIAVRRLIRSAKFFPAASEIRTAALEVALPLPAPDEAWGEVVRQIRDVGSYAAPRFSAVPIAEAVQTMGWRAICASEEPERTAERFKGLYATLRKRHVESAQPDVLWIGGEPVPALQP